MEYHSSMPIYLQVLNDLKNKIITQQLGMGEKLPSVRDLALSYKINPNTASRVYMELEREGLSFTKRGMGTFVTEDPAQIHQLKNAMALELTRAFLDGITHLGYDYPETLQMIQKHSGEYFDEPAVSHDQPE